MAEAPVGPGRIPGGEAEGEEVSLVVKSPAQRHPDLRLTAQRSWSVRRLKAELRRRHPDAPVSLRSSLPSSSSSSYGTSPPLPSLKKKSVTGYTAPERGGSEKTLSCPIRKLPGWDRLGFFLPLCSAIAGELGVANGRCELLKGRE